MQEIGAGARSYLQTQYMADPIGGKMSYGISDYRLAKLHQERLLEDAKPSESRPTLRPSRRPRRFEADLMLRIGSAAAVVAAVVLAIQQ